MIITGLAVKARVKKALMLTEHALGVVKVERLRQDQKWGLSFERPDAPWLGILTEEVGEVARATLGNLDAGDLRRELIQVAAVAVAWYESLEDPQ